MMLDAPRGCGDSLVSSMESLPASLLEAMFNHFPSALFLLRESEEIAWCNPAATQVFGFSGGDVRGRKVETLFSDPGEYSLRKQHWDNSEKGASAEPFTASYRCCDGRVFWGETHRFHFLTDQAGLSWFLFMVQDISSRRQRERHLRILFTALESAGEAIVLTNPEGVIQYVNPAFESITGYSKEEAVGLTPRILKSGRHESDFYRKGWQMLLRGEVWRAPFINRKKDGTLYHAADTIASVRDAMGNLLGFVGVQRDVTLQRQLEEELRRYALVYQRMTDGVAAFDDSGRIRFCNPAMEELTGRTAGELIGHSAEIWGGSIPQPSHEKDEASHEERIRRAGDAERIVSVRSFSLQSSPPLNVAIYRDITRQKQAERNMREAQREKEQFYRFIIHDINKPLAAIAGFAQKLKVSAELPPKEQQRAERIHSAASRLQIAVERHLELERLTRGSVSLHAQEYNLTEQIAELIELLREKRPDVSIYFNGVLPGEPQNAAPFIIVADAVQAGRVFQNLIDNALKFARGVILLEVTASASHAAFRIWNDGPPIPPDARERIFDEFQRLPDETQEGYGIGLAAVRKLLQLLGGAIQVDAPTQGGTEFVVTLPRRPEFAPGIAAGSS